jgi:hypothetical protein
MHSSWLLFEHRLLLEQEIPGFRTAAAAVPRHSEKNLKDYLFYNGYRNIRVLDPCMDLRSLGRLEHPTLLAYSKRAAATAKINDRMRSQEQEAKRRKESFGDSGQSLPDARRGRMDPDPSASPRLHRGNMPDSNRRGQGRSGGRWAGADLY